VRDPAGKVILFDAYGTLFDVEGVTAACAGLVADPGAFVAAWRRRQLEYSWLRTLLGRYVDFEQISAEALEATAAAFRQSLSADAREVLLAAWLRPTPFPEVPAALAALTDYRLGILSNGSPAMLRTVLEATSLADRFAWVLSVDAVRAYKPSPAAYALGVQATGLPADQILFVSSNYWDAVGAATFGYRACWVRRNTASAERLGREPDRSVSTLSDLPALLSSEWDCEQS
jgi:2-haloacid dehalogenase